MKFLLEPVEVPYNLILNYNESFRTTLNVWNFSVSGGVETCQAFLKRLAKAVHPEGYWLF
jgi:hypothetical protein